MLPSADAHRIDLIDNIHALNDLCKRRETLPVEESVVFEIDKHLRRARIWTGSGKRHVSTFVRLYNRVVPDCVFAVFFRYHWVSRQAKLKSARVHE